MSLINQALRKAQQDRAGSQNPDSQASSPKRTMPTPGPKSRLGLIIALVVTVAVLAALLVGLTLILMRRGPQTSVTTAPVTTETKEPAVPESVHNATSPTAPALPVSRPDPLTPEPSVNQDAERDVLAELREARETIESELESEKNTPSIVEWLTRSRINGVRLSQTGSKVIMNGNAYLEGEYVNFKLGLKVLAVEEARVLFIDESGQKYMKRL